MKLFKNYYFLLSYLISAQVFAGNVVQINKLSEGDILQARNELCREVQLHKLVRCAFVTSTVALAGFAAFKAVPWVKGHLRADQGSDLVKKCMVDSVSLESIKKEDILAAYTETVVELTKLENKNNRSLSGWTKDVGVAISMAVLSNAGSNLVKKPLNWLFTNFNLRKLIIDQLETLEHFQRLKLAQLQLDPQSFIDNVHYQLDTKLCDYAKEVVANFKLMTVEQQEELQKEALEILIQECDLLVKQMGYIIAYMRYLTYSSNQNMLNIYAEQLNLSTYEFACKVEQLLANNNISELFNVIALFHSNFNITFSSALIFSK